MTAIILTLNSGCSNEDVSGLNQTHINSDNSIQNSISSTTDSSYAQSATNNSSENVLTNSETITDNPIVNEFNAVWFSYFELTDMIKGKSEEQFRQTIQTAFKNISDLGLNAVIMHVRPSSDAFYNSNIYPWSVYCSGKQGVSPGYDPLKIMIEEAHLLSLQVHAWINPLRVGSQKNLDSFADSNPAKIWLTDNNTENDDWVKPVSGGYYYNPTIPEVRQLIIDGVTEIIDNYDIDGFQFDDYFYPTTRSDFDQNQYDKYLPSQVSEKSSRTQWRLNEVNKLVKGIYNAIKQKNPKIIFGISPSSDIEYNTDILYADIHTWISQAGYIDYICPQIYFGFEHSNIESRFQNRLAQWTSLNIHPNVKLLIGLAPYKIGTIDGGSEEWKNDGSMLKKQIINARNNGNTNGFLFYSYTYLFGNKNIQKQELNNLIGMF